MNGSRVQGQESDQPVIAAWSETIYYGRQQNGYHGGATPQEMVCPLVMLTDKSSAYSGLTRCEYPKPDWWSAAPVAAPVVQEPEVSVSVTTKSGQISLFDRLPHVEEAARTERC